jgi:hypothetical protein
MLLKKYVGLSWIDLDDDLKQGVLTTAPDTNLVVTKGRKDHGYSIIGMHLEFDTSKGIFDDHHPSWNLWYIGVNAPIYKQIAEYYEEHLEMGVKIVWDKKIAASDGKLRIYIYIYDEEKEMCCDPK